MQAHGVSVASTPSWPDDERRSDIKDVPALGEGNAPMGAVARGLGAVRLLMSAKVRTTVCKDLSLKATFAPPRKSLRGRTRCSR